MTKVADGLALERTAFNRAVAPLIERGLVASTGGSDARVKLVSITSAGRLLLKETLPLWAVAQASAATVLAQYPPN